MEEKKMEFMLVVLVGESVYRFRATEFEVVNDGILVVTCGASNIALFPRCGWDGAYVKDYEAS